LRKISFRFLPTEWRAAGARSRGALRENAAMLDAQKAALQNNIRRRLVAIREHRHL